MRQNPTTTAFFEDEILPLFDETICMLLDNDTIDSSIRCDVNERTRVVKLTVVVGRLEASRIIGREHRTRQALDIVFSAICRNHGFNLAKLSVIGEDAVAPEQPSA